MSTPNVKRKVESDDEEELPLSTRKKTKKTGSKIKRKKRKHEDEESEVDEVDNSLIFSIVCWGAGRGRRVYVYM